MSSVRPGRMQTVDYLSSNFDSDYDARMTIAVYGNENSGKEVILSIELGLEDMIPTLEKNIQILVSRNLPTLLITI